MKNIALELTEIEGVWLIHFTNFPMWLKGDKTHPTFNYALASNKGSIGLRDEVRFLKHGKPKSIHGFDRPLDKNNRQFEWRGKGWMRILRSRWEILHLDAEQWGLIYFEKTLFTPEGYDVISRKKELSAEDLVAINKELDKRGIAEEMIRLHWD
ncbi:MAG: hypothetical protein AAF587_36920 [Bacteroidota bacterium]